MKVKTDIINSILNHYKNSNTKSATFTIFDAKNVSQEDLAGVKIDAKTYEIEVEFVETSSGQLKILTRREDGQFIGF